MLSVTFRQALIEAKLVNEDCPAVFLGKLWGPFPVLHSAPFSCYLPAAAEVDSRWTLCPEMTWDDHKEPSIILTISAIEGHVPVGSVEMCRIWKLACQEQKAVLEQAMRPGGSDHQEFRISFGGFLISNVWPGMLTSLQQL